VVTHILSNCLWRSKKIKAFGMKTSLYLGLLSLSISLHIQRAYAQKVTADQSLTTFQAGSWQLGLKEGYSRGNLLKNRNSLQLHAGYFLVKRLSVGLNATWSKEWINDFSYNDLSAGPYVRYQFTSTRFSPFLEASYQLGKRSIGEYASVSYPSLSMQSTQINPGVSIGLGKSLRLELSYGLQWIYFSSNRPQSVGQPLLGLTYLFR
jgi:hypothetical protein